MYEGKLNKAIKLLEECGYYYNMYETVGEINCPDCNEVIEIEFGDVVEMLKEFIQA